MNVDVRQPVRHLLIQDVNQGLNIGDGSMEGRFVDLANIQLYKPSWISVIIRTVIIASIVFLCYFYPGVIASSILAGLALGFLPILSIIDVADRVLRR